MDDVAAAGIVSPAGPDQGHPRKWMILSAVSIGMFMALLDVTIVNIAIPAIISDTHTTVTHVSWVLNAYNLVLASLFLSVGRVSDRFGQKRVFLAGLVLFTLFSLLCGLAPGIGWLVASRAGQGIGGAALSTVSLAIVLGAFPKHQQGTAVGLWGALGMIAAAVGPTLGGVLVTYASWHWIFFVNIPVGIAALVFAIVVIPEHRREGAYGGLDLPGIAISATGLFLLTLALIEGSQWGWTSLRILGLFAVAVVSYPVFLWWELHTKDPMFPPKLLRIRSFTAANSAMMFIGMSMGGTFLLVVIFIVSVLGYSELDAALALTVMPVTALFIAPNVGRLTDRFGPRIFAAMGAAFFVLGLVLLAQLDGSTKLIDVLWRGIFVGAGIGFAMPTLSAAAMGSLPPQVRGVGAGALNTLRQVGFTLGVALLVAVFSHSVAANARTATEQAVAYVSGQAQIPPSVKANIIANIERNAAAAATSGGGAAASQLGKITLSTSSNAPAGSPEAEAEKKLGERIGTIYKTNIGRSFRWPFYAAALAALLAVFPALLTGRRLGEHEGHEEMSHAQRAAATAAEKT